MENYRNSTLKADSILVKFIFMGFTLGIIFTTAAVVLYFKLKG